MAYALRHERVDEGHSNVASAWGRLRAEGQNWPTGEQWETQRTVTADQDGVVRLEVVLPMPAMSLVRLSPTGR